MLLNADRGCVHAGQETPRKIEAFAFTRYNALDDKVLI